MHRVALRLQTTYPDLVQPLHQVLARGAKNQKNHKNRNLFLLIIKPIVNQLNKKLNFTKLQNDFEILSVLRNLKIIGIFTRLSVRDKKDNYLKLIPYAWKLIELRIKNNNNLYQLKMILDQYFPKKKRKNI